MTSDNGITRNNHHSQRALLILDMLNMFDFPEGDQLLPKAGKVARKISSLKQYCKKMKIPVIYVNDNFGMWRSSWVTLFKKCSCEGAKGKKIAQLLKPDKDDYFILKPMHSGFYLTPLELLLKALGTKELIITGIAGNICVLFTAHDAHMRDFKIWIPEDCVASNTESDNQFALHQFESVMGFTISASPFLKKYDS